jgi:hypothetical protein
MSILEIVFVGTILMGTVVGIVARYIDFKEEVKKQMLNRERTISVEEKEEVE